jgi:hypothetical protein
VGSFTQNSNDYEYRILGYAGYGTYSIPSSVNGQLITHVELRLNCWDGYYCANWHRDWPWQNHWCTKWVCRFDLDFNIEGRLVTTSVCPDGQWVSQAYNQRNDRLCSACQTCAANKYRSSPCGPGSSPGMCTALGSCGLRWDSTGTLAHGSSETRIVYPDARADGACQGETQTQSCTATDGGNYHAASCASSNGGDCTASLLTCTPGCSTGSCPTGYALCAAPVRFPSSRGTTCRAQVHRLRCLVLQAALEQRHFL